MAARSSIEWTNSTWNPVTGCSPVSPGCEHCYAERLARRLQAMGRSNYANGFELTIHKMALDVPLRWRKPQAIFVNSMSDLFHESVSVEFILDVFGVMRKANWHYYQVLTKRSERMLELSPALPWASNIWMGVSVERADYEYRLEHLRGSKAFLKFASLEPLLGPMDGVDFSGLDWVIVGGESGPGSRPLNADWVRDIRDRCGQKGIPFFFKQWGGTNKKKAGRELDGEIWNQMPESFPPRSSDG